MEYVSPAWHWNGQLNSPEPYGTIARHCLRNTLLFQWVFDVCAFIETYSLIYLLGQHWIHPADIKYKNMYWEKYMNFEIFLYVYQFNYVSYCSNYIVMPNKWMHWKLCAINYISFLSLELELVHYNTKKIVVGIEGYHYHFADLTQSWTIMTNIKNLWFVYLSICLHQKWYQIILHRYKTKLIWEFNSCGTLQKQRAIF